MARIILWLWIDIFKTQVNWSTPWDDKSPHKACVHLSCFVFLKAEQSQWILSCSHCVCGVNAALETKELADCSSQGNLKEATTALLFWQLDSKNMYLRQQ